MADTTPIDTVAFILIEQDAVLAEKRKLDKCIEPGKVAIPGGKVEAGESRQEALKRELKEELGIEQGESIYVCSLLYKAEQVLRINYYWILAWTGKLECHEAEELLWVPLAQPQILDCKVDRIALELCKKMASDLKQSEVLE
jgi:mutator protein MutT